MTNASAGRTKLVGKSITLDRALNREIRDWQAQTADHLGVTRVTFQSVVDALLEELLEDNNLAVRLRGRIFANLQA